MSREINVWTDGAWADVHDHEASWERSGTAVMVTVPEEWDDEEVGEYARAVAGSFEEV